MAQIVASSPDVIYDTLVSDATFMAEVGEYTFLSGTTSPSISIVSPGANLPSLQAQTGLEVIIHDVADVKPRLYLTSAPDLSIQWKVFLIAWSPSNGTNTMAAVRRIIELFPLADSVDTVNGTSILGVDFQTMVRIPSESPITA